MAIRVVPHDPLWRTAFDTEAGRIERALGDVVVRLHHIGSTAIPGLPAKPIIDIVMEVVGLSEVDERTPAMVALGYEAMGEFGIAGRRYFRRDDASGARTHQVHTFGVGSPDVRRHLAFRDYMMAHPDVARSYGELKQRLADEHPDDMIAYMKGKDAFVKHHEARALAWQSAGGDRLPASAARTR